LAVQLHCRPLIGFKCHAHGYQEDKQSTTARLVISPASHPISRPSIRQSIQLTFLSLPFLPIPGPAPGNRWQCALPDSSRAFPCPPKQSPALRRRGFPCPFSEPEAHPPPAEVTFLTSKKVTDAPVQYQVASHLPEQPIFSFDRTIPILQTPYSIRQSIPATFLSSPVLLILFPKPPKSSAACVGRPSTRV